MTIKEVEQLLEVPRATVRFYEKEGFLTPQRGENGYREYSEEEIFCLKRIIVLRKLGMPLSDIRDVLEHASSLSEALENNIRNLETQIEELKGALLISKRMRENNEELSTFDAEKYWKVIEEEERKGNHFFDIAKDVVQIEKGIVLDHFGIADKNGNLSRSIPEALGFILLQFLMMGCIWCLLEKGWTVPNFLKGIKQLFLVVIIECVVGLPIALLGKKHPFVKKHKDKIFFGVLGVLFLLCAIILLCLS